MGSSHFIHLRLEGLSGRDPPMSIAIRFHSESLHVLHSVPLIDVHGYPLISLDIHGYQLGLVGVSLVSVWGQFGFSLGSVWEKLLQIFDPSNPGAIGRMIPAGVSHGYSKFEIP